MRLPTSTPSTSWRVISRQAATAIMMHSLPPACRISFQLKPKPTHIKKMFWHRSWMVLTSKEKAITPDAFRMATAIENSRPETTGAGIANFFRSAERLTMAWPERSQ